jgi:hypothetical protein
MVSIFPVSIFTNLKAALEASSLLPYVDTVSIRKFRGRNFPSFDHHAIIISPVGATSEEYNAGGQRRIRFHIHLILVLKALYGENDAVMGITKTGAVPNVGILKMYEDVYCALYKNTLSSAVELYPGLSELDGTCEFNFYEDETTKQFLVMTAMPYIPSGDRFIIPE